MRASDRGKPAILLDELGYVQLDPRGAELLFQIITEREERASIAIGTNLPFSEWGTVFPTPASSPPSSTASPSTPTSSRPAPVLPARHQQDQQPQASQLGAPQRVVYGLREPVPARRRRSRASFSDSEVMGCPTVC
jgi:hypothetical protein